MLSLAICRPGIFRKGGHFPELTIDLQHLELDTTNLPEKREIPTVPRRPRAANSRFLLVLDVVARIEVGALLAKEPLSILVLQSASRSVLWILTGGVRGIFERLRAAWVVK